MRIFRRLFGRSQGQPGIELPARGATPSGTLTESVTLDAVFRALSYLQTVGGQLTLSANRDGQPRTDLALVRKPDNQMTQREWIVANIAALSTTGNAYWRIVRNIKGDVIDLRFIDPGRVVAVERGPGSSQGNYWVDGKHVATDSIVHLRYLRIPGRLTGLGPIEAGRNALSGALLTAQYGQAVFKHGGVPRGILSTDQPLTDAQIEEAATRWDQKQHAGKTAVLGRGLTYKPTGISPSDLQWLESQKFDVIKVARLFGIPPIKLAAGVDGAGMTYINVEGAALDMMRDTLMGYLRPIEDAISAHLPHGTAARFNLDAVLRPDTKTRYEAHKIGLDAGFLTVEEVRDMEKLGPLTKEME